VCVRRNVRNNAVDGGGDGGDGGDGGTVVCMLKLYKYVHIYSSYKILIFKKNPSGK
jgi:GTPase involved in cell partitioning and DNA repair